MQLQLVLALAAITFGLAERAVLIKPDGRDDNAACHRVLWSAERQLAENSCGMKMHDALEAIEAKKKSCQQLSWGSDFELSRYELHDRVRSLCGPGAAPYDTYVPDRLTRHQIDDAEEKLRAIAEEEEEAMAKAILEGDISKEELKKDIRKIKDGEVQGEADLQSAQDVLAETNLNEVDTKQVVTVEDVRLITAGALDEHPDTGTLPLQENDPQSGGMEHVMIEGDMRVPKEKAATLLAVRALYKIHKAQSQGNPLKDVGQKIEETGVVIGDSLDSLRPIFLPPKKRIAAGAIWPNGDVPYCFDPDVSHAARRAWNEAVAHYRSSPAAQCIRLREVSASGSKCETGHGIFVQSKEAGACWSDMGYAGRGGNTLNLGQGCEVKGLVVHEIGHALGMDHEQSRPDRDRYVKVKYENIRPGLNDQFDINPMAYTKKTYDYLSVMHYGQFTWSKDRGRLSTIEALNGQSSSRLGQMMGLSDLDVQQLGDMYCVGVDMTRRGSHSSALTTLSVGRHVLCIVAVFFSALM